MIDEQRYRALIQQLATGGITGNNNNYMNGGGVGSMMQPRMNFAGGGGDFIGLNPNNTSIDVEDLQTINGEPIDIEQYLATAAGPLENTSFINSAPSITNRDLRTMEGSLIDGDDITSRYGVQQDFPTSQSLPSSAGITAALGSTGITDRNDPFAGMNALERDLAQVRMNTSQEDFNNLDADRFKEMNGINFIDQPINNILNRQDNSAVGILDKFRSQQNPEQSLVNKTKNKFGELFTGAKEGIMNTGQRFKEGASKVPSLFVQAANYRNPMNPKASNYNPNLVGQLNALDGMDGMLVDNANSGLLQYGPGSVLRGQNAISGFGTNDYGDQLDEYIEKMKSRAIKKNLSQFQTKKLADAVAERQRENDRKAAVDAAKAAEIRASAPAFNPNTASGGRGDYRSDRDNSRAGGYGGSGRASRENRSSDLGFSDIRLKDNIKLVGKSPSDINIYNFTYLNNPKVYQGVMAQEVPWASVEHDSGYLMVDYNKVDVDFKVIH
mgnify:CR=1 FL=1